MKLYIPILPTIIVLAAVSSLSAQRITNSELERVKSECSIEFFKDADLKFSKRNGGETQYWGEIPFRKILADCPDTPFREEIVSKLHVIEEERGARDLLLAKYYLEMYWKTGRGLKGAQSRLLSIVRRSPSFSRLDEVRFWLDYISSFPPDEQP